MDSTCRRKISQFFHPRSVLTTRKLNLYVGGSRPFPEENSFILISFDRFSRTTTFGKLLFELSIESCIIHSLLGISRIHLPLNIKGLLEISESFTLISMSNDSATNVLVV